MLARTTGRDSVAVYDGVPDPAYEYHCTGGQCRSTEDTVVDGGREIARLTGRLQGPDAYVPPATGRIMTVALTEAADTAGDGFTAQWTCL